MFTPDDNFHPRRPSGRRRDKQRPAVTPAPESDPNATLNATSSYSINEKYFFFVNDVGTESSRTVYSLLLELCCARRTLIDGRLHFDYCITAKGNRNYFAKLAAELRKALGAETLLQTGDKCYWLLFLPENITLSPGLLEMKGLHAEVIKKLASVINNQ